MAQFPQGLTQIDRRCANAGERRVLHQLKRCLSDDCLVWHNVPLGPRARQPDFVVLGPRLGLLVLEVKAWRRNTLREASPDAVTLHTPRGPVVEAHPLRQARDYALELADLLRADPLLVWPSGLHQGHLVLPYGWAVVCSHLKRAELSDPAFDTLFAPHRTLLADDLDEAIDPAAFFDRLLGAMQMQFPHTLSLPQRDRVRWHLFPELRLGPGAQRELPFDDPAAAGPSAAHLLAVLDLQQEQLARALGEGHRVVHGVAGSGKTLILVVRAQQLAQTASPTRPVLVLCFNRALAQRLGDLLAARGVDPARVVVRTFHAWCDDLLRSYALSAPAAAHGQDRWAALADAVVRGVAQGRVPAGQYHAVLIDEAHDFAPDWLRVATQMVDPATQSLLVMYDDAQSIYRRERRWALSSVGISAVGRTHVLRLNYRNTAEVLGLAARLVGDLLGEQGATSEGDMAHLHPDSAGRHGPLPVLLRAADRGQEALWLADRIAQALTEGVAAQQIAVLTRTQQLQAPLQAALRARAIAVQAQRDPSGVRGMDWNHASVKLLTLHSAKGLEFQWVAVAGLDQMPHPQATLDEELRLLYVGLTRATHSLCLACAGDSVVVRRVASALAQMQAPLAQIQAPLVQMQSSPA